MQSKAIKDFNIRNVKTDKVDAYKLALLYRMKIIRPSIVPDALIQQLRDLCRNHYELSDQLVVAEARIRSGVEQVFPGYAKIFSRISGQSSIAVYLHIQRLWKCCVQIRKISQRRSCMQHGVDKHGQRIKPL